MQILHRDRRLRTCAHLHPSLNRCLREPSLNTRLIIIAIIYTHVRKRIYCTPIITIIPETRRRPLTIPNLGNGNSVFLIPPDPLQPLYVHVHNFVIAGLLPSATLHSTPHHRRFPRSQPSSQLAFKMGGLLLTSTLELDILVVSSSLLLDIMLELCSKSFFIV